MTDLQASLQTSIREEVDGAKQRSVAEAGALAMSSGQQQHQVAAEAASALLEEILGGIGNRRMRRATAARLSGELSTVVRQGFATTEEQATAALAEIVQVFGTLPTRPPKRSGRPPIPRASRPRTPSTTASSRRTPPSTTWSPS